MTWLVFGVSALLVLAGAVSVSSGAPIIQLERGWAEVISGSVAISGGGVVFALGVVLMRLEALRDAVVAASALPPASSAVETVAAQMSSVETPDLAAPLTAFATVAAEPPTPDEPSEASADGGLWKRIRRPDPGDGTPDGSEPAAVAVAPATEAVPPAAPLTVGLPDQDRPPVETLATPLPETRYAKVTESEDGHLGWLDRSLFGSRSLKGGVERERSGGARIEPSLDLPATGSTMPPELPSTEPQPTLDAPATDDPLPVAAEEGPTVIGRYQAGVASYVMYSDGTIEVETEGGQSHRFGSMDELKAFIADQDKAVT